MPPARAPGWPESAFAILLWPFARRLGLTGDFTAAVCIPAAAVATVAIALRWPRRVDPARIGAP
jgi:hypothetical protein